ncbi:MAG: TraB/GumN family protein [Thermoplasmatota archaeon]
MDPARDGSAPSAAPPMTPADAPRHVTLLGTGHVFDLGARVRSEIFRRFPHAIAIELDAARYHALRTPKSERARGRGVAQMLADFQERLAESYGVEAGSEMLAAADAARDLGLPLVFIDRDARDTFRRLFAEMKFGERIRLLASALGGMLLPAKSVEKQLDAMTEDYASTFEELGAKFPTVKRVLIDERNAHMTAMLAALVVTNPRVVAVMGDGHVDGVEAMLRARGIPVETVRLKALRAQGGAAAIGSPVGNASATVTHEVGP